MPESVALRHLGMMKAHIVQYDNDGSPRIPQSDCFKKSLKCLGIPRIRNLSREVPCLQVDCAKQGLAFLLSIVHRNDRLLSAHRPHTGDGRYREESRLIQGQEHRVRILLFFFRVIPSGIVVLVGDQLLWVCARDAGA